MPALASHRKPRSRTARPLGHSPAVGVTTAAIASVTLLSAQSAAAAPAAPAAPSRPTVEEVRQKVTDLYRQAGTAAATGRPYGTARLTAGAPAPALPPAAPRPLPGSAPVAEPVAAPAAVAAPPGPEPVRALTTGTAGMAGTAGPEPGTAPEAVGEAGETEGPEGSKETEGPEDGPAEAGGPDDEPDEPGRETLRIRKESAQDKLAVARILLARHSADARHRQLPPAAAPGAGRATGYGADAPGADVPLGAGPRPARGDGHTNRADRADRADRAGKVLAFARAQLGKPYVWGATGPSSYDGAGLARAAWRAAGVELPRAAWSQAKAGARVAVADLRPGDLVFFDDGLGRVGVYQGDGTMIHAPGPGTNVREESIHHLPVYGGVRPA
ncbi:C40 family peptidase [Streptomyces sp. LP05-1]|uniref:C40 family peptidase n=1 Tax=Streptomyces pyxinae TaxID=2970734 RepID=A0ABT2CI73_9ACTN|nr:C40 family peptidase [Streptomyces sp. LP05-1]MCS0637101.1 C40 family peptidase [Streptomyces sp. LP05-1]